ncbi:MAG: cyclic nucleotide-binding domain-containing protein [Deltaproteobacteria bacterium]|nr:cyclic nucleotide-binding domain-containing protein [Deltaproteobacteria bacterium]MBW2661308.1 cyclic nucleotide-binding domain-containing protein [Deltaproteobacteria bacterium]
MMEWKNLIKSRLSEAPIFSDIPEEVMTELFQVAEDKVFPAQSVIFSQGDHAESCFVIKSGKVRIFRKGKKGVVTELVRLGVGKSFGEIALLTGHSRPASVETLAETRLAVIPKDQFDRIFRNYPDVLLKMLKQVSGWLVRYDSKPDKKTERRFRAPGFSWFDFIAILGLSILFGIIFNMSNPNSIKLMPKVWSGETIPTISTSEAMVKYTEEKPLFLDARPSNFFRQRHIKNAINFPPALFDIIYMIELSNTDKNKEIILYGRNISRLYDEQVARKLVLRGYRNTKLLNGGIVDWEKSGYPVEP